MSSIWVAIQVILPLFMLIALGYGLRWFEFFDGESLKVMNDLVFRVFLPVLIFVNIYNSSLEDLFNAKLIVFALVAILSLFCVACLTVPLMEKEVRKQGVLVQGLFRGNFVIFSLPIVTALFPETGGGVVSLLVAFMAPVLNGLSVITFEIFRKEKVQVGAIFLGIIKNPQIIASFLGVFTLLVQLELPVIIEKSITDISGITTPFALIVLGGSFLFAKSKGYWKQIIIVIFGKLVFVPMILLPFSIVFGFRQEELASLMVLFATPVAVSSFAVAAKMDGDGDLASQLVVWTSALSIVTMCAWIALLTGMGWV